MIGPITLLLLPLLLLAINDSWIFTYLGNIDPWVYFGYFTNLRGHLRAFPGTYYGTRLAWIVPGALAHEILPPTAANYVLHLGVYYTAVFALYFTLTRTVGRRAALLAAIFAGCYSYFLFAVGWHYGDGAGLAYYSVALACLTAAIDASARRLALVCAGAAVVAAVHTNLVWVIVLPAFGYYYLVTTRQSGRGRVSRDWIYVSLGSLGLTLALGVVAVAHGGTLLFFAPSIRFATQATQSANPYRGAFATWVPQVRWLVFPAAALVSTIYFRVVRSARETPLGRLLADHFLGTCALFIAFDLAGGALLQFPFYMSYVIPAMVLAVGVQIRDAVARLSRVQYGTLVGTAVAVFALTFLPPIALRLIPQASYGSLRMIVLPFLLLLAGAGVLRVSTNMLTLATFVVCTGVVNLVTMDGNVWDFRNSGHRTSVYRATVAADQALTRLDPDVSARFWYNESLPLGQLYTAIASTRLWGYRLVGIDFPSLLNPFSHQNANVEPGQNLIILTTDGGALTQAKAVLRQHDVDATLVATRQISEGDVQFTMLFVRTSVDRRTLADAPLPGTADVFVAGSQTDRAASVNVDPGQSVVHVTTNRSTYDWQLVSRPVAVSPSRRHLADFELRIPTGGAGFHVIATKTQAVLASRYWCQPLITSTHQQVAFDTGSNDSVRFVLSNCGSPDAVVSDFEVKRMQVWPYRSDVARSRQ
jgi:hypothetical protein